MGELVRSFHAVQWLEVSGAPVVRLLDQRRLPHETVYLACSGPSEVQDAIRTLAVRGAPAIGIAAAYGVAQELRLAVADGAERLQAPGENLQAPRERLQTSGQTFDERMAASCRDFAATRPTAVNLFWAIDRMRRCALASLGQPDAERARLLVEEAAAIHREDLACCLAIGDHGAALLPDDGGVLTHCNTGGLATGGHGTALGVIRSALAAGKRIHTWIDETRPLLQGARLTAWECAMDALPATLITDNMAGHLMKLGRVQAAIAGADRIARNGDSANKIGTYQVAILCQYHNIPFYIAAPTSTVDLACAGGDDIPIEERGAHEVTHLGGHPVAAQGVGVFNPAFDVVPAALIAGIITEQGVARSPFTADLTAMVGRANAR